MVNKIPENFDTKIYSSRNGTRIFKVGGRNNATVSPDTRSEAASPLK